MDDIPNTDVDDISEAFKKLKNGKVSMDGRIKTKLDAGGVPI